jgi:CRISPR-associated protein Csb1
MTIKLDSLAAAPRLLFKIRLEPLQGQRFQPTGFPGLGAATYPTSEGQSLLVESPQSMANRLEAMAWDPVNNDVVDALRGISHVRVVRKDKRFLTDTVLEAHRLNSPYLLEESSRKFFNELKEHLGGLDTGPIDRKKLGEVLLDYDVGSLLHGVFLAKKELAGGRLRVARAMSAFIEAENVRIAPSGGVKNDHVNPSGDTKKGFGNVPFARDEYTAEDIFLYVNVDLAQIRGYGLAPSATALLTLLALYKLRALVDGDLRLRAACDLHVAEPRIEATAPAGFPLPGLDELTAALKGAIAECKGMMTAREAVYADELKTKADAGAALPGDDDDGEQNQG